MPPDPSYPNRIDAVRLLGYPSSLGPAETYYDSNAAGAGGAWGGALRTKLTHTKTDVLPTIWPSRTEAACKLVYTWEGDRYAPRNPGPTYEKINGTSVTRTLGGFVKIMPDATTQPAAAAPRSVCLIPASLEIRREEPLPILAAVSGVGLDDNPLHFQWTGVTQGLGNRATLEVSADGKYPVSCTVTNARGEVIGTDSVEILAELPKELSLTKRDPSGVTVVAGQPVTFEALLTSQGRPVTGDYVFRWEPHPEVVFDPHEGPDGTSRATFVRPGKVRVWVEALRKQGGALATVARSEQMELEVTKPALTLTFTPATPYVGQATRVAVAVTPPLAPRDLDFRWDFEGNIQELGESPDSRERTFIPRDDKPVRWTAHARSRPQGDDLGEITGQVAAKPYVLSTQVGKPLGPLPVVYRDAAGFVEVEDELAVGQVVPVTVALEPLPDKLPVRFQWSANGDTELVDGAEGPMVRARRTQPGQAVLRVVAFDAENTRLGEATAQFAVAISQATLDDGARRSPRPERFEIIPCEAHRNGEPVGAADTFRGLKAVWVVARFAGLPPGTTLRSRFERDGFVLLEKKEIVKTAVGVFLYQFTGDPEVAPGLYRASFRVGAVPVGEKQFTVASGQTGREVTWVERSWGAATLKLPANWVLDLSAADRVAWCAPTGTPADAAVVLRRAASAAARWEEYRQNGATLERREAAILAGKPAILHSMLYVDGRFRFWMLTLDDPQPDGTHLSASLAGRVDQWSTWEPILQQIRDSIRVKPIPDL